MERTGYRLTRQQLLYDLYLAFYDARRHKAQMSYVVQFEKNLRSNLETLCDDLLNGSYTARPSKCFIIDRPKKREVFAALFRDRVVHHLYYNYTHLLFERTFIADTYSCIPGRGTHYGIQRLTSHIRQESQNWTQPCYVMNLDIRGYFMHIRRDRLLEIANGTLQRMASHPVHAGAPTVWADVLDMPFLCSLTEKIIMLDPRTNCEIVGSWDDWKDLDRSKSLFFTPDGCGLPIGNLTSQLFSNVYLNVFDQFMKRTLCCRHYGRYVDDSYVVSADRHWLLSIIPEIRQYLLDALGLELHMGKLHVRDVRQGVEFLGAFVKPYREYVSNSTLKRMRSHIMELDLHNEEHAVCSINSFLGVLSHNATYNIRRALFADSRLAAAVTFDAEILKCKPRERTSTSGERLNFYHDNYEQNLRTTERFRSHL